MDDDNTPETHDDAMPAFDAYRRGYDPDQVDRYVTEQQQRLDEATQRATQAEHKLSAAVGQLRELHGRVAALEAEEPVVPPAAPAIQPLDTLGERVQRILQEAWDGAFALRQSVEKEIAEQREQSAEEARDVVASARRKAQAIEEEIERRRRAYLERLEEDRTRASAQIAHLNDQRLVAVEQLQRMRDVIDEVVIEAGIAPVLPERADVLVEIDDDSEPRIPARLTPLDEDDELPPTMPVHRLEGVSGPANDNERADLVRSHRESVRFTPSASVARPASAQPPTSRPRVTQSAQASVFDFEEA